MFHVKAQNFLSYKELDFDFSNLGLCLIEGINKQEPSCKSNGAGKTSLIDSICWGLYGKSFKVKTADKVVNLKEGGNCKVEVEWDKYRVVRYRKHQQFKNDLQFYDNGVEVTAKSNKDTQEMIENALGLSYESFVNAIYFQQNNLTSFATATDSEQKAIIENILGFNVLSEAHIVAKDKVKEINGSLTTIAVQVKAAEKALQDCAERYNYLETKEKEWGGQQDKKRKELEKKIEAYEAQKLNSKVDFDFTQAQAVLGAAEQVEPQIKELSAKVKTLTNSIITVFHNRTVVSAEIKKWEADKAAKERELAIYANYQTPTCPTCKQAMPEADFYEKIKQLIAELEGIDVGIARFKEELDGLETDEQLQAERDQTNEKLEALRNSVELANKLRVRVAQEMAKLEQLEMIDSYILELKVQIVKLETEVNPYVEEQQKELTNYSKFEQELDDLKMQASNVETEAAYYRYWVDGLANSKLKSYIMDSVTPMLNERANYYSGFLTGGSIQIEISTQTKLKNGEMRDKFSVNLYSVNGVDYELCSGGEKKRIDLCILLALQSLVASRAKASINLLILDEVAENLDEVGIERMIDLLRQFASEKGSCLYVTHSEEMKPFFSKIVTVIKENGITTVNEHN